MREPEAALLPLHGVRHRSACQERNALDKSRDDIVKEIAVAEGVDCETSYGALIRLPRGRLRPFVLLVDAVGEAPEREGSRCPRRKSRSFCGTLPNSP